MRPDTKTKENNEKNVRNTFLNFDLVLSKLKIEKNEYFVISAHYLPTKTRKFSVLYYQLIIDKFNCIYIWAAFFVLQKKLPLKFSIFEYLLKKYCQLK